jgi:hypothetical protein
MSTTMDERWSTVEEYVQTAHAITWDECHKIYVLMDEEQVKFMREIGYNEPREAFRTSDTTSPEQMMTLLRGWYEESCGLRFINAVETINGDPNTIEGFTTLIEQGAEDEGEDW